MPPQSRLSDIGKVQADAHGCPACPHMCVGPIILGSPNVLVNMLPAARVTDVGVHAACCGPNMFTNMKGSATVKVNELMAHRRNDMQMHCGGVGKSTMGSPNVITGG